MSDHQSLIEQQHIPPIDGLHDAAGEAERMHDPRRSSEFADCDGHSIRSDSRRQRNRLIALRPQRRGFAGVWQAGRAHRSRPASAWPSGRSSATPIRTQSETGLAASRRPLGEHDSSNSSIPTPPRLQLFDLILGWTRAVIELPKIAACARRTDAAPIVELRVGETPTRFAGSQSWCSRSSAQDVNARPTEPPSRSNGSGRWITSGRQALASPQPPQRAKITVTSGPQAYASHEDPPPPDRYDGPTDLDDDTPF